MELKSLIGDPATGEVIIKLSDGKPRVMKFDHKALRVLQETFALSWYQAVGRPMSSTTITAFVYAGCFSDAQRRKEPWSVEVVDGLIEPKAYAELWTKAQWAIRVACKSLVQDINDLTGELGAAAQRERKASRGHSRKRLN
jgi:hypothetical protein